MRTRQQRAPGMTHRAQRAPTASGVGLERSTGISGWNVQNKLASSSHFAKACRAPWPFTFAKRPSMIHRVCLSSGAFALGVLLLVSCGHSPPMENDNAGPRGPFDPTPPVQLTFNPGADGEPAMLGTGEVAYSFAVAGQPDLDVCLGILSPAGGSRRASICATGMGSEDSNHVYRFPAPLAGDTLSWFRTSGVIPDPINNPLTEVGIVKGAIAKPAGFTVVRTFPTTSSSGQLQGAVSSLRATGDGRLAYVAMQTMQRSVCTPQGCSNEAYLSGREVSLVDPTQQNGQPETVAGTDYASSVSRGANSGDLIYTLAGDSRVFARSAAGVTTVLHDFGGSGIARDAYLAGNRLVAIVGGSADTVMNAAGDRIQRDRGGALMVVDLNNGDETVFPGQSLKRWPIVSPDGRQLVVQAFPFRLDSLFDPNDGSILIAVDTVLTSAGDLFRYDLP